MIMCSIKCSINAMHYKYSIYEYDIKIIHRVDRLAGIRYTLFMIIEVRCYIWLEFVS